MDIARLQDAWPELSALLDEALALPDGDRIAWLDALSPERAIHRDALWRLLGPAGRRAAPDFLDALPRFADATGGGEAGGSAVGDLVGPYRLIEAIGRGGMGSVWLAERADRQPLRRVALKMPHIGWEPSLNARLARERDILASLEHPHIARLYDAGIDQLGRPYLALEYVAGLPIDRYVETQRLSIRRRLEVLLQVMHALAHAHARLVVHRDLKPSNILVAESGDVRLLDFGIAKLLHSDSGGEASELTRIGGRGLTPDYASPEQIRGEAIGTASDIYSMGVVGYEILAGTRPYRLRGANGISLAQAIAEAQVPLASCACVDLALARQLTGDLDAILNKALKKDSAERYPTVDAFAADIERHLRGEPVEARPDSAWYRLERWVRRHKLETATGAAIVVAVPAGAAAQAAVLAAIACGAGVALWQARHAQTQARLAELEKRRAQHVKDFVLSILLGANTDAGAGAATTAADLLKAARQRIEVELAGQPETAIELMTVVGDGLFGLGLRKEAATLLSTTVERARRELGPQHQRTVAAKVVYGSVLVTLDRATEAATLLHAAIAESRRQQWVGTLIDGLRWLSSAQFNLGEVDAGLASAEAAVAVLSELRAPVRKLDAINAWASLANARNVAQREGQADAARHALSLARDLYGDRMTESVLSTRLMLAKGLAWENRDAEALEELASVFIDVTAFFGPEHPMVETVANFLGQVRLDCGDAPGAAEAFRTQLAAAERSREDCVRRGLAHSALARALVAMRRREEALAHYEASARFLSADGSPSLYAWRSLSGRALALARLGRLQESQDAFDALASAQWTDIEAAAHAGRLSGLCTLQGRHDEAIALARKSLEGLVSHPSKVVRATSAAGLGAALLGAGLAADAVAPLRDAVRLYEEKELFLSADRADALADLARAERSRA